MSMRIRIGCAANTDSDTHVLYMFSQNVIPCGVETHTEHCEAHDVYEHANETAATSGLRDGHPDDACRATSPALAHFSEVRDVTV